MIAPFLFSPFCFFKWESGPPRRRHCRLCSARAGRVHRSTCRLQLGPRPGYAKDVQPTSRWREGGEGGDHSKNGPVIYLVGWLTTSWHDTSSLPAFRNLRLTEEREVVNGNFLLLFWSCDYGVTVAPWAQQPDTGGRYESVFCGNNCGQFLFVWTLFVLLYCCEVVGGIGWRQSHFTRLFHSISPFSFPFSFFL